MKEITAENLLPQEVEAPRLSFCDLPTADDNPALTNQSPITSSPQTDLLFEFFVAQPGPAPHKDIVFCGKNIKVDQLNEYQKRDYFATTKSPSFRKQTFSDHDVARNRRLPAPIGFPGGLIRPRCPTADRDYHVQTVNITSLTSMSAKSRRRMFMFGPVKFKPEMELCAIKQRQAKLAPAEKVRPSGGRKSQWGLIKSSLRGRSHLTSVLARSLGCIPVAGRGVGSWVGGMTE